MSNEKSDSANDWTQYQKLVLDKLEKHDEQLDNLQKELVKIQLTQVKASVEMSNSASSILSITDKIEKMLENVNDQKNDIGILKLKIYAVATALCAGTTILIQWIGHFITSK